MPHFPGSYLLQADARALPLREASVQTVVTSPPYWGLRDYGLPPSVWGGDAEHAHEWGEEQTKRQSGGTGKTGLSQDGRPDEQRQRQQAKFVADVSFNVSTGAFCPCGAWRGVVGLEPTPELYVQHLVEIFREVRRVLRADGTCWVNLGDSYATGTSTPSQASTRVDVGYWQKADALGRSRIDGRESGLKPKDLVGIPWRVAFALQADGWWLRADVIWSKPNPMPESITDRPTKAHEYLFLLTKAARYYYDGEAIKEPNSSVGLSECAKHWRDRPNNGEWPSGSGGRMGSVSDGRNRRSVWSIATEPYPAAHFATFPEKLVEPCILAGTSARGACPACGAPWAREVERDKEPLQRIYNGAVKRDGIVPIGPRWAGDGVPSRLITTTLGWSPSCACSHAEPVPCRVLDPFAGSGTTVAVAERLGRVGIGVELKPDYLTLARRRTVQAGLL